MAFEGHLAGENRRSRPAGQATPGEGNRDERGWPAMGADQGRSFPLGMRARLGEPAFICVRCVCLLLGGKLSPRLPAHSQEEERRRLTITSLALPWLLA